MSWLTPLGFLGLIGLIILIIIYIIKPNYQQKIISSTFVWKLSLKYRRKKIPINHLRNLLIFICQVLIITACAMILAQPFLPADEIEEYTEKVVIIDASASMRAEIDGVTRFERAVADVKDLADEVLENDGMITIILAGKEASYIVQRAGADLSVEIAAGLEELVDPDDLKCTYGEADINGAIALADKITSEVPNVDVLLYTGNSYIDSGKVIVKNDVVTDINQERNAAILDARAVLDENYYRFEVDVAAYGIDNQSITVSCQVRGANYERTQFDLKVNVNCPAGEVQTIVFSNEAENEEYLVSAYSYESVWISIEEDDSFTEDNSFFIYGGAKQPLKIQYYSTNANNFFSGVLMTLRDGLSSRWDIDVVEVKRADQTPAFEGFDIYIFEDTMPAIIPSDGLVMLVDPDPMNANLPLASGLIAQQTVLTGGASQPLVKGEAHPITENITVENITVTEYIRVTTTDANFIPLMYSASGDPVVLAKDTDDGQMVLIGFDLNYSNVAVLLDFPMLIYNIIEYYIPSTITDYAYEVDETVSLNSRGNYLSVSGPKFNKELNEFPTEITVSIPGTYTLMYPLLSGNTIMEEFFVKIPATESNIFRQYDELKKLDYAQAEEPEDFDLVFYFAIALVALLFIEWWLQSREHF